MESRTFIVSTDDGVSHDVRATHCRKCKERFVTFYRSCEGGIVATFNLDHVTSIVPVELPTPEE